MREMDEWDLREKERMLQRIVDEMRWDSQRRVLGILSRTLTKRKKLRFQFGSKNPHANLRTTTIKLPSQFYPHPFIDWILKKGVTLHESYHIMFTGDATKRVKEFRDELYRDGKYFKPDLFKLIMNALEDARIEHLGVCEYKGSAELLGFCDAFFYRVAKLEKERMEQDLIYSLCFELKGYETTYHDRKLLDKLVKVGKKVLTQDFDGMVETSIEIYKIIDERLPKDEKKDLDNDTFRIRQVNKGFKCDFGEFKEFDNPARRTKSKLSKEELKEVENEMQDIKEDFIDMFDSDEIESEADDTGTMDSEQESEESEESEEMGKEDMYSDEMGDDEEDDDIEDFDDDLDSDMDEDEEGMNGDSDDGSDEEDDEDEDEEPLFEDLFDDETIEKIESRFEEERESNEKIERQIKQKGGKMREKIGKEYDDSFQSGLDLAIPKKSDRVPFSRTEAESTANLITDGLRNKIVIGKTKVSKQTSGKLKLKSAVRSFVKYDISGEFDNHIYEKEMIETPEHSVLLSIDCSASMSLETYSENRKHKTRLDYAKEVLFILAKVFKELGVEFSIRGFNWGADYLVKTWDEEFDYQRLMGLKPDGSTPTPKATDIAFKRLQDVDDDLKIIFTITDGEPDGGQDGRRKTRKIVEECNKNGILVFGIFYGGSSESEHQRNSLREVYGEGNYIVTKDSEELKEGMIKLYEKVLKKSSYGFNGNGD